MMAVNFGHYLDLGWKIIPISKRTKIPSIKAGKGFTEATSDPDKILEWIGRFPDCNWGLVCANSGLVCVDVDAKGLDTWDELVKKHGEPQTLVQQSGSGIGKHYVFKAQARTKYAGRLSDGIDIKHNGFIIVEPSIHPSGKPYQWVNWMTPQPMPEWLFKLCAHGKQRDTPAIAPTACVKGDERWCLIATLIESLRNLPLSYHEWVALGQAIHAETGGSQDGLDLYLYLTEGDNYAEGDEDKAVYKWKTFQTHGGRGYGTIKRIALERGVDVHSATSDFQKKWARVDGKYVADDPETAAELVNSMGYAVVEELGSVAKVDIECNPPLIAWKTNEQMQNIMGPYYVQVHEKDGAVKYVSAFSTWLKHTNRTSFNRVVFDPNDRCIRNINLWQGIERGGVEGDITDVLTLVKNLCNGDIEATDYVLDWCAHIVQHPEAKPAIVPVFIAKQGAGKNFFAQEIMGGIVGSGNFLLLQSTDELLQQFNGDHARKFLTVLDEASWGGNGKLVAKFKAITGSTTRRIEEKYAPKYEIKDYSRFMVLSNSQDAVRVETGNRRFLILDSYSRPIPDRSLFRKMGERLRKGDLHSAWLYFLENRDISDFDPYTFPSHLDRMGTEAKVDAMTMTGQFWFDLLFQEPKRIVDINGRIQRRVAYSEFKNWCDTNSLRKLPSELLFWHQTAEAFGHEWPKDGARNNTIGRYVFGDILEMRKLFIQVNRVTVDESGIDLDEYLLTDYAKNDF